VYMQQAAALYTSPLDSKGNFYAKIQRGEFTLAQQNGTYVLDMKNVIIEARRGQNAVRRTFDIHTALDGERKAVS